MHRNRRWRLVWLLMPPCWLGATAAGAQISPGPLARAHEELEGTRGCLSCHQPGSGVSAELCLQCHEPLRQQLRQNRGLHARPEYRDCGRCHIEHQGADFDLVWWGDEGMERFDHALVGFVLREAHAERACRDCHRPALIANDSVARGRGVSLTRTFLGLGTGCRDCHADIHAGRFAERGCESCHGQRQWEPVAAFDHATTAFALEGAHARLDCSRCHRAVPAGAGAWPRLEAACVACHADVHGGQLAPTCEQCHGSERWRPAVGFDHDAARYRLAGAHLRVPCVECHPSSSSSAPRFRPLAFAQCSACHDDSHAGRLGEDCAGCHTVNAWAAGAETFDHDRTPYALRGRHREIACEQCHRPGQPLRIERFEACSDCHLDAHQGQLAATPWQARCENCHDVDGFKPARFGIGEHRLASYPLLGAHERVPCSGCHLKEKPVAAAPAGVSAFDFHPRFESCGSCHADPHGASLAGLKKPMECAGCHAVQAWNLVEVDHEALGFPLLGRHATTACDRCHPRQQAEFRFAGTPADCAACHVDAHRGQFLAAPGPQGCVACHDPFAWKPSLFDHARAAFVLDGAHLAVPCAACHPTETDAAGSYVRYRPLPSSCEDCHRDPRREEH